MILFLLLTPFFTNVVGQPVITDLSYKLTTASTLHTGGDLLYYDLYQFTYEGDLVQTQQHLWEYMNSDDYYTYYYDGSGRLIRKELGDDPYSYFTYWTYEYDDLSRTKSALQYGHYWNNTGWSFGVGKVVLYQYDEDYTLLSVQTDNVDYITGEVTSRQRTLYSYNPEGNLEAKTQQTLAEGEWTNTSIAAYLYAENGRIAEQQNGQWSDELGDWDITQKITHEFDEESLLYTISFYKKSGDNWVWDVFNGQTILFEPELKWQQKALTQMTYDDMQPYTLMNQIVLTMEYTPKPSYTEVDERKTNGMVYPNPSKDGVTVSVPTENAVVRFYDLQGRLVAAQPFSFKTNVNTNGWAKGVYLWEVWNGFQKEASGKWVKE